VNYQLINDGDVREYYRFCLHHAQHLCRILPDELWHYTDATGLSQFSSLENLGYAGNLPQRYIGAEVFRRSRSYCRQGERRNVNINAVLEPLFRAADELLNQRDFTALGQFVACFSEAKDDLGQWPGYGGGDDPRRTAASRPPASQWAAPARSAGRPTLQGWLIFSTCRAGDARLVDNGCGPDLPSIERR
jgi:hypothetical protein